MSNRHEHTARTPLPVFPCVAGGKEPETRHGFEDATTDPEMIALWRRWWPDANWAMPTGPATYDVLDVDVHADGNGFPALDRLKRAGLLAGAVRLVRTPSGGLHLWFPGTEQECSSLRGRHHLDFKATGGYVLLPGSYFADPDGEKGYTGYYVELDRRDDEHGRPLDWAAVKYLLDPPRRVVRRIGSPGNTKGLDALVRCVATTEPGNRNRCLHWAACRAAEEGYPNAPDELVRAAITAGLKERAARATVESAYRAHGGAA